MALNKASNSMIEGAPVNVKDFGAVGDGVTDDTAAIQAAINAAGANSEVLIPSGTYIASNVYIDKSNLIIKCNKALFDQTGIANPVFIIGQKADGNVVDSPVYGVKIFGMQCTGDKTLGSTAVKFRKASTCTLRDCRFWLLDYPFIGDGFPGHTYESILCEFQNIDSRYNIYGLYDTLGSFQGSHFIGGRYEANDRNGFVSNSPNIKLDGVTIEANAVADNTRSEIYYSGNGTLDLTDVYVELRGDSTADGMIEVPATSNVPRVTIKGGTYYAGDAANRYILDNNQTSSAIGFSVFGGYFADFKNWTNGTYQGNSKVTIIDSLSNVSRIVSDDATFTNGGSYLQYDRATRLKTNLEIVSEAKLIGKELRVQDTGSQAYAFKASRFIGRIATSGAGTWHDVVTLSDVGGLASTSLSVDLSFLSRAADFYFQVHLIISGTSSIAFTNLGNNNWPHSSFRISGGVLQVDNLPATNRDWSVSIDSVRSAFS